MTNAELIASLRRCSYTTVAGADSEDGYCKPCAYFAEDPTDITCMDMMMIDAADALEAADEKIAYCVAAIDALEDSNDAYIKENERLKKRIAELEAQLPKEGEWISEWGGWLGYTLTVKCSICGAEALYRYDGDDTDVDRVYSRCCPHCGAKMKGEQEETK